VAFEAALDELVNHHRFLLSIYATHLPDGTPFSFAEVEGAAWRPPHLEWVAQYRRLFERATNHLAEDPRFLATLANVPTRLLYAAGNVDLSVAVQNRILDLGPVLADRLESWFTKRTISGAPNEKDSLAGSDKKVYLSALRDVVGAWEGLLQHARFNFGWSSLKKHAPEQSWSSYQKAWPFLWQHLSNTAYMLATAVWNQDEAGAEAYRDALLRWPTTLHHRSVYGHFPNHRFLFPKLLEASWSKASGDAEAMQSRFDRPTPPDELFDRIMWRTHEDVVLLASTLLICWTLDKKLPSKIGLRNAWALISPTADPTDVFVNVDSKGPSFGKILLDLVRFEVAGERFSERSYGARLSHLVATLDNMTERPVVSGRVFTPSTLSDREGLLSASLTLLLATIPTSGDDGVLKSIQKIAQDEKLLPDGDASLRRILDEIGRMTHLLSLPLPEVDEAVDYLRPKAPMSDLRQALTRVLGDAASAIEATRLQRLKERKPDIKVMESLRLTAEKSIFDGHGGVRYFRNFLIAKADKTTDDAQLTRRLVRVQKGELLDPPMRPPAVNFVEVFSSIVKQAAHREVWAAFTRRPREKIEIGYKLEDAGFWEEVAKLKAAVGDNPLLLVSQQAGSRGAHNFLFDDEGNPANLSTRHKPSQETDEYYIVTIEDVDIYTADFPVGHAWLFSSNALRELQYALVDDQHYLSLGFERDDDVSGVLKIDFSPRPVWSDNSIFEIICVDPADEE